MKNLIKKNKVLYDHSRGTPLWKALFFEQRLPWRYKLLFFKLINKDIDFIYDEEFATSNLRNKNWDEISSIIINQFNPKSIIDFGCGTGDILSSFEKKGITVLGIDGSKANRKYSKIKKENFILFDLRKKFENNKKYDICLCMEVAEHIEEKYSNNLINNLTSSSKLIIFTAAPPGQGGLDHCNEKEYHWWIKRFNQHDYILDCDLTKCLKKEIAKILGDDNAYVRNLLIFKKQHSSSDL